MVLSHIFIGIPLFKLFNLHKSSDFNEKSCKWLVIRWLSSIKNDIKDQRGNNIETESVTETEPDG